MNNTDPAVDAKNVNVEGQIEESIWCRVLCMSRGTPRVA
jgi:hypothetical protein